MGKKIVAFVIVIVAVAIGVFMFQRTSKINAMQKKLDASQERFQNEYVIYDSDEYERLVSNCESAISDKNYDNAKKAQTELDEFEQTTISENKKTANESIKTLEKSDTSKAYQSELDKIKQYKEEMQDDIKNGQFKQADKIRQKWQKLIDDMQKELSNLDIKVVQVDTSNYPKVKLYLDIRDNSTDKVPSGLKKSYFYLLEKTDKKKFVRQDIIKAAQLDQNESLNINMVADASGSMQGSPLTSAKSVMQTFLNSVQFSIGDQVELTTFSTGVHTVVAFTKDKTKLDSSIQSITTDNMTSLYDALYAAVNTTAVQSGAKCVIAFTDGKDNYSKCKPDDVIEIAKKYKIPVFIIGIGSSTIDSDVQRICSETGGFYRNITNISNMSEIYSEIYKQQKELYMLEYKITDGTSKSALRTLSVEYNDRNIGGKQVTSYTPNTLMTENSSTSGLSEPEKLMKEYLPACVKAINNHDFSYIEKYMVKDGPVYKENKEYIKNNFTEEFLSCKIIDIKYPTKDSCIVHLTETYKIQNNKEPLHMRTLESYYKLLKQSDGSWQVYSYPKDMKVIKKIRY